MTRLRRWGLRTFFVVGVSLVAADRWIGATELPDLSPAVSKTVLDREGRLLRAYTVADGRWRLPVALDQVDPSYIDQLIAYEDKRFWSHSGVDLIAGVRAVGQFAWHGQIVSGGSTLTMQVARLLEEGATRSLGKKLRQVRLALALERTLSKNEILELYLTLAPFGGNIEGVRAASLSYFGKEPRRLTEGQAALLVALPQSPEARRPDRSPSSALAARNHVLSRLVEKGVIKHRTARAAMQENTPSGRSAFPVFAPHLADRLKRQAGIEHRATLDRTLQSSLEALLRKRARALGPDLSAAILVADHRTGEVLASVGSSDFLDARRQGFVDMTRAVRSPGSTLKPLIYGLGFEAGVVHPEMLIEDRPTAFGGYTPGNFDKSFQGTVSVRDALQRSLNIPAVAVLDRVGPAHLMARMRRAGVKAVLPNDRNPGLAIGLGGVGITLHDLVTLYAAVARGGEPVVLRESFGEEDATRNLNVLSAEAAWQIGDILASAPTPDNARPDKLAFKTGTSYGHRDAWAIGFDGQHVLGVWVGRPDGASARSVMGIETAAPILFEAFSRLKPTPTPLPPPPGGVLTVSHGELPEPLKHFRHSALRTRGSGSQPEIAFPPNGATLDLGLNRSNFAPLTLKVRNGAPPFTWLADGQPLEVSRFDREVSFDPDGPGFISISVIDRSGQAARTKVFVE